MISARMIGNCCVGMLLGLVGADGQTFAQGELVAISVA